MVSFVFPPPPRLCPGSLTVGRSFRRIRGRFCAGRRGRPLRRLLTRFICLAFPIESSFPIAPASSRLLFLLPGLFSPHCFLASNVQWPPSGVLGDWFVSETTEGGHVRLNIAALVDGEANLEPRPTQRPALSEIDTVPQLSSLRIAPARFERRVFQYWRLTRVCRCRRSTRTEAQRVLLQGGGESSSLLRAISTFFASTRSL